MIIRGEEEEPRLKSHWFTLVTDKEVVRINGDLQKDTFRSSGQDASGSKDRDKQRLLYRSAVRKTSLLKSLSSKQGGSTKTRAGNHCTITSATTKPGRF